MLSTCLSAVLLTPFYKSVVEPVEQKLKNSNFSSGSTTLETKYFVLQLLSFYHLFLNYYVSQFYCCVANLNLSEEKYT